MLAELRETVVERALAVPASRLERAGSGDLLSRVGGDVAVVSQAIRMGVPEVAQAGLLVSLTLLGLAALNPRLPARAHRHRQRRRGDGRRALLPARVRPDRDGPGPRRRLQEAASALARLAGVGRLQPPEPKLHADGDAAIAVHGVHHAYVDGRPALHGIDLHVAPGADPGPLRRPDRGARARSDR